jgi:WD40 repeat protein
MHRSVIFLIVLLSLALPQRSAWAEHPPRADCFGDPLPPRALARLGTVRFRHGDGIAGVAFSPDGKTLASAGLDHIIRLWDVATGRELRRFVGHTNVVWSVAFSPDGTTLASASLDLSVRLWRVATGEQLLQLDGHRRSVNRVLFAPNGKLLASSGQDGLIRLWDVNQGRELQQIPEPQEPLAFTPDSRLLITGGRSEKPVVWDVTQPRKLRRRTTLPSPSWTVAVSPDSKLLAVGEGAGLIRLWDLARGRELSVLGPQNGDTTALAFAEGGKTLLAMQADGIHRWEVATGTPRQAGRRAAEQGLLPELFSHAPVLSPAAQRLAAWPVQNTICFWDVSTNSPVEPFNGHTDQINKLCFGRDGKTIYTGSADGTLRAWEATEGRELTRLQAKGLLVSALARSPDGACLASGSYDGMIRLWDVATGKVQRRLEGHRTRVLGLAFSPDGQVLYSDGQDQLIRSWDVRTGKELRQTPLHKRWSFGVAFAPDGQTAAIVGDDQHIHLLDLATGTSVRSFGEIADPQAARVFSPDGKSLASGGGRHLSLWEVATGQQRQRFSAHYPALIHAIAFSPDGRTIAWGSTDRTVRMGDVATGGGRVLRTFEGHQGWVTALAFSPDGRRLVSGSRDTTALIWDADWQTLATGELTARQLEQLWADLAGEDAVRAYEAVWTLAAAHGQAVPLLRERLRPAKPVDSRRVAQLIADLDNNRFALRQRATEELRQLHSLAAPALRIALARQPSAEVRHRAESLLQALEPGADPDLRRELRSIEVLEHAHNADATQLLQELATGSPDVPFTREAKTSLERLTRQ